MSIGIPGLTKILLQWNWKQGEKNWNKAFLFYFFTACFHKCPAQGKGGEKGQQLAICPETHFQPIENSQLPNSRYVYFKVCFVLFAYLFFNHRSMKSKKTFLCSFPQILYHSHMALRWVVSSLLSFTFSFLPPSPTYFLKSLYLVLPTL